LLGVSNRTITGDVYLLLGETRSMNIDFKRFLALTSLMSAPLVAAGSGCIITTNSGDDTATTATDSNGGTGTASVGDGDGDGDGDGTEGADGTEGDTEGHDTEGHDTEGHDTEGDDDGETEAGDSTGEEPIDPGNCCDVHVPPGCTNETIQECVCEQDDYCCSIEGTWDEMCVGLVANCGFTCPE
jgi:hypothetical protein